MPRELKGKGTPTAKTSLACRLALETASRGCWMLGATFCDIKNYVPDKKKVPQTISCHCHLLLKRSLTYRRQSWCYVVLLGSTYFCERIRGIKMIYSWEDWQGSESNGTYLTLSQLIHGLIAWIITWIVRLQSNLALYVDCCWSSWEVSNTVRNATQDLFRSTELLTTPYFHWTSVHAQIFRSETSL